MAQVAPSKNGVIQTKEGREQVQEASSSSDDGREMEKMNDRLPEWTPSFLQKKSILAFIACYLLLLLGLVILAIVDTKKNGITTAKSTNHYLWTYGPTAVLAIVAALWGQVEHRTKQAMPWVLLHKETTISSDTLLLDYITVSETEAFIKSLRHAHWPVVITIVGSLLIKLLTVASTGLLVLQNTQIQHPNCQLVTSNDFVNTFESSAIGSSPVLSTLAINNGTLAYTPGTTRDMAFQTLNLSSPLSGAGNFQIESVARAFQGELDCETAKIRSYDTFCSDSHCHGIDVHIDIDSPSCQLRNMTYGNGCSDSDPATDECDFGDVFPINCTNTAGSPDAQRLVVIVGRIYQNISGYSFNTTILPDQTTTLICSPKYSINDVLVRTDLTGNLLGNATTTSTSAAGALGFTGWDLLEGLQTSTEAAGLILDNPYAYSSLAAKPWLQMWAFLETFSNNTYNMSELKNPDTLKKVTNDLFSMATAQMAKQDLMDPARKETTGTCYSTAQRLRVRGLSLYLMAALLVLKIVVALAMLSMAPRNFTPRDPSTIGSLALILANSPSLLDRLCHQGSSELESVRSHLLGTKCRSIVQNVESRCHFSVEILTDMKSDVSAVENTREKDMKIKWWRPLSILPIFKVVVAISLILVAVALEILYWRSEKSNGLAQVDAQGYIRFIWVYVPAIVMLIAQTLVGTIAFGIVFIFPFYVLRTKYSSTRNDIVREYVSKTAIQSLWHSAMNRHFPVFLMAVTMLMAPLLTIVVSGLYTAQPIETRQLVTLSTVNQFNSSFRAEDLGQGSSYDAFKQASLNIGLLTTQNFSFPAWTHDELVFPEVEFQDAVMQDRLSNFTANNGSKLYTRLPAIRGDLDCSLTPGAPKNISDWLYGNVNFTEYTELGCSMQGAWPLPGSDAFGFFDISNTEDTDANFGNTLCGAYGTNDSNWRAFTCAFKIQQFSTSVTLSSTSFAILDANIDSSIPPQTFSNQTFATDFMPAFPSAMIPSIFGSANFAGPVSGFYDPAFQAVIYQAGTTEDPKAFPMREYMDDAGFHKIAAGLTHVYRIVVAQTANLAIRVLFDADAAHAPAATTTATLTNPHVYRLKQSGVSTRILDGLLVALALCIGLSFWVMDTRRVLPKNPASIAAGASLLAGNMEMFSAEKFNGEAQWWDDKELERRGVWQGYVFSLGWWSSGVQGPHGEVKRFGIDVGRADR
ncbi:uncharacterized protein IWZ02DRAFT_508759 [Phyllosticta citriasiana]|uniref:Uncharacterized protein n=1 Tax=Phyllosticta citriasiana TaxID=595635 RepID=A0ABR1KZW6_9PEZI